MKPYRPFALVLLLPVAAACGFAKGDPGGSGPPPAASGWSTEPVVSGLNRPWGIAWLPSGEMLITEKGGNLLRVAANGSKRNVTGVPGAFSGGQGGLMDVSLHPKFAENGLIYLTMSVGHGGSNRTVLVRGRLNGTDLVNASQIFAVSQPKTGEQHFGSRLLWLPDGTLLMSIGDGGNPPVRLGGDFIRKQAQNRASHYGKVVRLTDAGKPAPGNPFLNQAGAAPEVWSYGHRNIQGLARDPQTGRIWANEHGAKGGDEVNLLEAGKNFGWPLATHSTEYWGPKISDNRSLPGMVDPKVVWSPATGPSGLAFYTGDKVPAWRGALFSGGLASRDVRKIQLDASGKVTGQSQMKIGKRVRDVRQGPDGYLYILTDEGNGQLLRLVAK